MRWMILLCGLLLTLGASACGRRTEPGAGTTSLTSAPIAPTQKDERISTEVQHKLAVLGAEDVRVSTAAGRVTLQGSVRTREERDEAVEQASRTAGVNSVDNKLEIRPLANGPFGDPSQSP